MQKNRLLSALCLCLLCTGCSTIVEMFPEAVPMATTTEPAFTQLPAPETEPETIRPTFPPKETEPETTARSEEQLSLYDELYTEISQFHSVVKFERKIDADELSQTVNDIERQHPEIFWLNGYSMRYNDISAEVTFKIINDYSPDELRAMADMLDMTAENLIRTISPESSDYDKALQIHDYLIANTVYDQPAVSQGKGLWSTAYGCFIERKAVCQGYSQAFQLLMNRMGIECGICSGDARGEAHAWNYIRLNGQYYWIDVTWDDPVSDTGEESGWIHHGYFLINDDMLSRSRTFDENQFRPLCSSLEENYFVRNNNYLTVYDFYEIDRRMTEHAGDGRIEVMFSNPEAYQMAVQDLFENGTIWKAQVFQSATGTVNVNYQPDDDMYILRLIFQ